MIIKCNRKPSAHSKQSSKDGRRDRSPRKSSKDVSSSKERIPYEQEEQRRSHPERIPYDQEEQRHSYHESYNGSSKSYEDHRGPDARSSHQRSKTLDDRYNDDLHRRSKGHQENNGDLQRVRPSEDYRSSRRGERERSQRGSSQNRSQSKTGGSGGDRYRESTVSPHPRSSSTVSPHPRSSSTVSPHPRSSSEREVKFKIDSENSRHYRESNLSSADQTRRSTKSSLKSRSSNNHEKDLRSSSEREVRFSMEKTRRKEKLSSTSNREHGSKSTDTSRSGKSRSDSSRYSRHSSSEKELGHIHGLSSDHECCSASDCNLSCSSDCRQSSDDSSQKNEAKLSSSSKEFSSHSSASSHNSHKTSKDQNINNSSNGMSSTAEGSKKKVLIRSRSHDSIIELEEESRLAEKQAIVAATERKSRSAEEYPTQPFFLHSPTISKRSEYSTIQSLFYEIPDRPTRYEGGRGNSRPADAEVGHKKRAAPAIPLPPGTNYRHLFFHLQSFVYSLEFFIVLCWNF